ncbi:phosphoribosylaminoimidazole carboxylase Ade6 [Schizosaccharomyces japonicus yFS275]|uniref:Phosphoribosylaminoimidazole carboxylase n=1 Tax=Schizosaccharomyces japonicus (strain yFS275 / FY16936) TaxID=402676 RepID=B6JXF4_SCHJY|nr:phosphoribosylaminoimidazole carboxylase Ade6 [Schizosaccharomyces japonicus yFS275]EEB06055.1 phosphoribosylaminoimidazole carboxylase Ade6 [Schizosaccharomyces japonicus yFS275]
MKTVGILGGGQLGRMMIEAAHRIGVKCIVLDAPNCPAKQVDGGSSHIDGSFKDADDVKRLADLCDVVTTEIEHVNTDALEEIATRVDVQPTADTLRCIQDKYLQKQRLSARNVALPAFLDAPNSDTILEAAKQFGYPLVLKSRTLAYDGRGNYVVHSESEIPEAMMALGKRPLYVEKFVPFKMEIAVMVVKTLDGKHYAYPTVETVQKNNVCQLVYAPARISPSLQEKAQTLAKEAVEAFTGAGIYGVEMFVLEDGTILLNEIAPRPHNSGHYTIEACATSQFEAHLRAVVGLPFNEGNTQMATSSTHALMVNLLGTEDPEYVNRIAQRSLTIPGATLHLYGKDKSTKGRKMGHITIIADSLGDCEARYAQLLAGEKEGAEKASVEANVKKPLIGIIMGSDSDLPVMKTAAEILESFDIPYELTIVSAHRTPTRMYNYARSAASRGIRVIIAGAGGAAHLPGMVAALTPLPVVGVPVKGSTLDGVDSLHSIVQMPRGVPVATVAINNSTNAALLAAKILGTSRPDLLKKLQAYMDKMESEVLVKAEKIESLGWREY